MLRRCLLALLLGTVACSDQGPPPGLSDEIEVNRAVWRANRPASYRYSIHRQCFCGAEARGPVEVEVSGSTVVGRVYVDTGEAVPRDFASVFPSVDGLFDVLEDAVARRADEIQVVWDPTTGIPMDFFIDYSREIADEESGYEIVAVPTPR